MRERPGSQSPMACRITPPWTRFARIRFARAYCLATASSPVPLEILDAHGKLVRRYSSTDQPELSTADLETIAVPLYWVRLPKLLSPAPGMHRWVWDLHYPPPQSAHYDYPIS